MLAFEKIEGEYRLHGLRHGENFRDENSYDEFEATWLKVNDVAFAAPAGEFGEHQHTIVVEQETDGGGANIVL